MIVLHRPALVGCRSGGLRFTVYGGLFPLIFLAFGASAMHSYRDARDRGINAMPTSCRRIRAGTQQGAARGEMSVHSEFLFKLRDRLAMRLVSKRLSETQTRWGWVSSSEIEQAGRKINLSSRDESGGRRVLFTDAKSKFDMVLKWASREHADARSKQIIQGLLLIDAKGHKHEHAFKPFTLNSC
jgi:hypothetical protein